MDRLERSRRGFFQEIRDRIYVFDFEPFMGGRVQKKADNSFKLPSALSDIGCLGFFCTWTSSACLQEKDSVICSSYETETMAFVTCLTTCINKGIL